MGNGVSLDEERNREMMMMCVKARMEGGVGGEGDDIEYLKAKAKEIWSAEDTGSTGNAGAPDRMSVTLDNLQQHTGRMLESISQVAAAHVLDRTAEMRASLAKKSFGREATDTSFGSSSSADKDVDLASLLPPPRISLSIDVDVVNDDSEVASLPLGDDTPKGKGGKTRSNSSSGKMHLVDFHDGSMKET